MSDRILDSLYYSRRSPAFMTNALQLYRAARLRDNKISYMDVVDYLRGQRAYTLHRAQRHRYPRARTSGIAHSSHVQADLADLSSLMWHNGGMKWILVCVDVTSRMLRAAPLRTKGARDVTAALVRLLESYPYTVSVLTIDSGMEFWSREVRDALAKLGITAYQLKTPRTHAAVAERAVRTLKTRLFRAMTAARTKNWTRLLADVVDAINHTPTRPLGKAPVDITAAEALSIANEAITGRTPAIASFAKGDRVRLRIEKQRVGAKGYTQSMSGDPYEIIAVYTRQQPTRYRLAQNGNTLPGIRYSPDLERFGEREGPRRWMEK